MSVDLLTEQHLEFLSLKGGCTGLSESTLVKIPNCRKSHVAAHMRQYMGFGTCINRIFAKKAYLNAHAEYPTGQEVTDL